MKILLIIFLIFFVAPFVMGIIFAATKGKKYSKAEAIVFFAQLSKDLQKKIAQSWIAFKSADMQTANQIALSIPLDDWSDYKRKMSQKKKTVGFFAIYKECLDEGYSERASLLIAGSFLYEFETYIYPKLNQDN